MKDGDVCGMVSLGGVYTDFAVKQENGEKKLVQRTGEWTKHNETETVCGALKEDVVYLRMYVEDELKVSFAYSTDGTEYVKAGEVIEATPGRWVGVKAGLFAIHEGEGEGGFVKAECFVFEEMK